MRTHLSPSRLAFLALALACVLATGRHAAAQNPVTSIGDVSPVDRPFVPGDQGIPTSGNTVETDGVNANGDPLDIFGNILLDEDGNVVGQFNYERSANIEVGRYASGQLLITGGGELRFGDLIIGGDIDRGLNANFEPADLDVETDQGEGGASGVGLVQIVGAGSLYNNHPGIIPTQYQATPETTTFTVPETFNPGPDLGGVTGMDDIITNIRRDVGDGFDLYVGLTGSGVLDILEGGRAEIYDGAFVGIGPNAVGAINVDGSGSYLGVYGMRSPVFATGGGQSQMIIGLYGEGALNITNGGRVDSFNRAALGTLEAQDDNNRASDFDQQGHGQVLVEGQGSVWRVFNPGTEADDTALSVGFFYEAGINSRFNGLVGDVNAYVAEDGRGTVRIRDGGLVVLSEDELTSNSDETSMRIGMFGELQLNGGRIVVPDRLDNDGLIRTGDNLHSTERYGDGVIETGRFLNSPLGQVRVRAGEHLQIRSLADDGPGETVMAGATTSTYQYANAGKIEVLGDQAIGKAEIEFLREQDRVQDNTPLDNRFKNLHFDDVVDQGGAMVAVRGQIKARDAHLFFRSDFLNEADVLFVGGDNVVAGRVENAATGLISLTNQSNVTFQDRVVNDGLILLDQESDVTFGDGLTGGGALIDLNPAQITVLGDFQTDGLLQFVIGGGPSGLEFTQMSVTGDLVFGENASLTINILQTSQLAVGDAFELIKITGSSMVTDLGTPGLINLNSPPPPELLAAGLRLEYDTNLSDGYTLRIVAATTASFGDFNGDNIVDINDYIVWRDNFGSTTMLDADANNDGIVDSADYTIWRDNLGTMPTLPLLSAAPEPTTSMLLLAGLLMGIAPRRRI